MNPVDFESLATTVGPVAAIVVWLYLDYRRSKKEDQPKVPDSTRIESLEKSLQSLDRRVLRLEIWHEVKDGSSEEKNV